MKNLYILIGILCGLSVSLQSCSDGRFWKHGAYSQFSQFWTFEEKPGWETCWVHKEDQKYYLKPNCFGMNYETVWKPYWHFNSGKGWENCWEKGNNERVFCKETCQANIFRQCYWKQIQNQKCWSKKMCNQVHSVSGTSHSSTVSHSSKQKKEHFQKTHQKSLRSKKSFKKKTSKKFTRFWKKNEAIQKKNWDNYWTFNKANGWERCWCFRKQRYFLKKNCKNEAFDKVWKPYWKFNKKKGWNQCWKEKYGRVWLKKKCRKSYFSKRYWNKCGCLWNRKTFFKKFEKSSVNPVRPHPIKAIKPIQKRNVCCGKDCSHQKWWKKGGYKKWGRYYQFQKNNGWNNCWKERKGRYYLDKKCGHDSFESCWEPFWKPKPKTKKQCVQKCWKPKKRGIGCKIRRRFSKQIFRPSFEKNCARKFNSRKMPKHLKEQALHNKKVRLNNRLCKKNCKHGENCCKQKVKNLKIKDSRFKTQKKNQKERKKCNNPNHNHGKTEDGYRYPRKITNNRKYERESNNRRRYGKEKDYGHEHGKGYGNKRRRHNHRDEYEEDH